MLVWILVKAFLVGALFVWYIMRLDKMSPQEKLLFAWALVAWFIQMMEIMDFALRVWK